MSRAYAQAGVNLDAAERAVELIKPLAHSTHGPRVLNEIGAFGGLFALKGYKDPVLVASTDGVGTKLKVAFALDRQDTIGRDLVALSVDDVLTTGARPLFFLDYIALGRLVPEKVEALVRGMADECRRNGCALLGGETAEMPDLYGPEEYDLAGFIVGAVERDRLIDGSSIAEGDLLWGLPSSGLHTNGFSLARRVLEGLSLDRRLPELGRPLGDELLEPHRSYLPAVQPLLDESPLSSEGSRLHVGAGQGEGNRSLIKGMAHITGGGLVGNIPRSLPKGLAAEFDWGSWPVLPIFELIQRRGRLPFEEMVQVFNMGLGFIFITAPQHADQVRSLTPEALCIGRVILRAEGPAVRFRGAP